MKPILILILCLCSAVCNAGQRSHPDSWKNFYAVSWVGTTSGHVRYAKQMGYEYISPRTWFNLNMYNNNPAYKGMKFYLTDPMTWIAQHVINPYTGFYRVYPNNYGTMTQATIDWYELNNTHGSDTTFPNNMATGWWFDANSYVVTPDFQQQRVIELVNDAIVQMIHKYDNASNQFTFAGYILDIPPVVGAFGIWEGGTNVNKGLRYWTGTNSSYLHSGITHEYSNYFEGSLAWLKNLNTRLRREFPNHKWILEPNDFYSTSANQNEWIYSISTRYDKDEVTPDMLIQERADADFVDQAAAYAAGVNFTKTMAGNSSPGLFSEYSNRFIASKAGVNGAWFNWFGRFGGTGEMPEYDEPTELYPRHQLVRCIPNWDNLNNVPIGNRATVTSSYGTETYRATHTTTSGDTLVYSYIGQYGMYSRHWKRPHEIFVVKMGTNTHLYDPVVIGSGEYIKDIYSTNEYFEPVIDVKATQWTKTGNSWQINEGVIGTATDGGVGFIFTVLPIGGYTN